MLRESECPANSFALSLPYDGHTVRVVGTSDSPLWVAADVCDVLGIKKARNALAGLEPDEKDARTVGTLGGPQEMLVVNEPGLYRLLLKSRKPEAKAFSRWLTHEVLPCIRRHGCYPPPEGRQTVSNPLTNHVIAELANAVAGLAAGLARVDAKVNEITAPAPVANTKRLAARRSCEVMVPAFGTCKSLLDWSKDGRCQVTLSGLKHRLFVLGLPAEQAIGWEAHRSICSRDGRQRFLKLRG